jgi:predicted dehydrogenase
MAKKHKVGIIGCGDLVSRWEAPVIKKSKLVEVKSLFDLDAARAKKLAKVVGGSVVDCIEAILSDDQIDIVFLFVPPFVRKDVLVRAARAGKHIITTKPLAPNVRDCITMVKEVRKAGVKCGVFYRRTGNAAFETYKKIFETGQVGKLALYKQDWIHHYPQWNNWATDPEKNGGPFMDAMIHNMNIAHYLMGRKPTCCTYFSDNYAHNLKCNDTEFMKLDFEDNGSAHLFITWAADLEVFSKGGNDREHIDITYMVTDKGWRLTDSQVNGKAVITASREGKKRTWQVRNLPATPYDEFAKSVEKDTPLASDIPDIVEAAQDIKLLKDVERKQGQKVAVNLSLK